MAGRPTVIDLFAGAGLFSFAFRRSGFDLLFAVEADKSAATTYAENLGSHVRREDVRKIRPGGRCDVLIAGPPCQGFSTLGKRNPDDERNSLSLVILPWVRTCNPKVVVIENVAAFIDSPIHEKLCAKLGRMGYACRSHLVNAVDCGVPQTRLRSFTIATRGEFPKIQNHKRQKYFTVREAWCGLSSIPDGVNSHYAPTPSTLALERMKVIPKAGDKRDIMRGAPELVPDSWWQVPGAVTDVWGRMKWDDPCNTLRTAFQNPSKGRYIHPEQDRVISLREAARLQSIPDSFKFHGLPTQVARQIGNSVPPKLGSKVARAIKRIL